MIRPLDILAIVREILRPVAYIALGFSAYVAVTNEIKHQEDLRMIADGVAEVVEINGRWVVERKGASE